jgi:thiol-disulfide isomerase/thioredoxin
MSKRVIGGVIAVCLVCLIYAAYYFNSGNLSVNRAPGGYQLISNMELEGMIDFELERLDGKQVKLSDYRGKVIVLNFWASWCNPCVQEFPSMVSLVEKMKGDVVIVAIATDDEKQDVEVFLKAFGLPRPGFEILWDKNKKVTEKYNVSKLPESFVVGRDFKLARKIIGAEDWSGQGAIGYFQSLLRPSK